MKLSIAVMVLVALLVPCAGLAAYGAAPASLAVGKSFLEHVNANYADERSDAVPANFAGPLVPQPRRHPAPGPMLLACLGLLVYLGHRRTKARAP